MESLDLKKQKRKLVRITFLLTIINLLIYNLFNRSGGYNLQGEYVEYSVLMSLKTSLLTYIIWIPIFSLLLGLLFAMIPYKGLDFSKKYFRASFIVMISINVLFIIAQLVNPFFEKDTKVETPEQAQVTTIDTPEVPQVGKVEAFRSTMTAYKDSSIYYLDQAMQEAQTSEDLNAVSVKYQPIFNKYRDLIDSVSKVFYHNFDDYGLSSEEYDAQMKEVMDEFSALTKKHEEYKNAGLVIE